MSQATTGLGSQSTGETTFAPYDPPGGNTAEMPSAPSAEDASRTWHFPYYLRYIRHVAKDLAGGLYFDLLMYFFQHPSGPEFTAEPVSAYNNSRRAAMNDGWRFTKSIRRELLNRVDVVRARVIVSSVH